MMNKFFSKKSTGPRKSFSGGFGDRDERPAMHSAVCNECGVTCEVPFKPNGRKPVLCHDCFRKDEGGAPAPRFNAPRFDRGASFDKPAFRPAPREMSGGNEEVVKQLKELNFKMGQLIAALTGRDRE